MARANTKTLLSLDRFAAIAGISPLHFNQVVVDATSPVTGDPLAPATTCGMPVQQYSWQRADAVGREEIAQAIADAESMITRWLGYAPMPTWIADEHVEMVQPANPSLFNLGGRDIRGFWNGLQLGRGYAISGGIEAWSAISLAAAIVYSDTDSDGYDETATITVPTTVTQPDEISIHYPGKVASGDYTWEIRPTKVSITAGVATIVARREQLVESALLEALSTEAVDGLDDTNFLATIDVYRHYNDPSTQIQFLWDMIWCDCLYGAGCANCTGAYQNGCLYIRDTRRSIANGQPGTWNATDNSFDSSYWSVCRMPDRARVWYRAGYKDGKLALPYVQMAPEYERAITYLALAMLDRPICECQNLSAFVAYWSDDFAATSSTPSGGSSTYRMSDGQLENPFGTTRAAMNAWRLVQRERIGEAVSNL